MKQFKWYHYLAAGVILALVVWFIFFLVNLKKAIEEKQYWQDPNFKPDTVFSETRYQDIIKPTYQNYIPPKNVTVYQGIDPKVYLNFRDSILSVVDSLKGTEVKINKNYITQYPEASKLVSADFTKDSLALDLLKIDGNIYREYYPVDYSLYKYQYLNNSIKGERYSTTQDKKTTQKRSIFRYDGIYLNYDRDLIQSNHKVSATGMFDVWKLRVGGYTDYRLKNDSKLEGGVRVGIRLF